MLKSFLALKRLSVGVRAYRAWMAPLRAVHERGRLMRSKIFSLIAVVAASVLAVPGLVQAQQPIRVGASMAITGEDAIPHSIGFSGNVLSHS